jgi:hypothetical protein
LICSCSDDTIRVRKFLNANIFGYNFLEDTRIVIWENWVGISLEEFKRRLLELDVKPEIQAVNPPNPLEKAFPKAESQKLDGSSIQAHSIGVTDNAPLPAPELESGEGEDEDCWVAECSQRY